MKKQFVGSVRRQEKAAQMRNSVWVACICSVSACRRIRRGGGCDTGKQQIKENIKAENDLGAIYEGGGGSGFPEDDAEALIWFRKAADQGSAEAQTNIGNLYYMDPSKPRDFAKALFWYRKAAEQGYAAAESQLGDLYQYGNGVPKDLVQARAWYQKAADQGDAGAKQSLANLDHEH